MHPFRTPSPNIYVLFSVRLCTCHIASYNSSPAPDSIPYHTFTISLFTSFARRTSSNNDRALWLLYTMATSQKGLLPAQVANDGNKKREYGYKSRASHSLCKMPGQLKELYELLQATCLHQHPRHYIRVHVRGGSTILKVTIPLFCHIIPDTTRSTTISHSPFERFD